MEQITRAYGLPKETVAIKMMLYKNIKGMVHPPDGDTGLFAIVTGVLEGDTVAPYLFIIFLDYIQRTSIEQRKANDIILKKGLKQTISR